MAARNRQNQIAPEIAPAQGPVPTSRLGSEVTDEATLLDGYEAHLRLLENRPKTTADPTRSATYPLTPTRRRCSSPSSLRAMSEQAGL